VPFGGIDRHAMPPVLFPLPLMACMFREFVFL
jgi:hypothetical protein